MSGYAIVVLILIFGFSFYMGYMDGSTAVATTVATRAMKPKTAIIIAGITKFVVPICAFLIGNMAVAGNISEKIIFTSYFEGITELKAFAFIFSALAGSLTWCLLVNIIKLPNSTSHTLLGSLIGAGIVAFGFSAVQWVDYVIVNVILMVILAPIIGLVFGFLFMKLIKLWARHATRGVNKILRLVQRINLVFLAGSFSNNNTQKSLGMFMLMCTLGMVSIDTPHLDFYMLIGFAGMLTLGMFCGGLQVVNTIGRKIFKVQDVHSVVAQMTTSMVMIACTEFGISVSTGQVMVSSIMGVGSAERANSVHWNTAARIVASWFLTMPVAAGFSALLYFIIGKVILQLP